LGLPGLFVIRLDAQNRRRWADVGVFIFRWKNSKEIRYAALLWGRLGVDFKGVEAHTTGHDGVEKSLSLMAVR
jgi:hypothetical protein